MTQSVEAYIRQVRAVSLTGYRELAASLGIDPDALLRSVAIDPKALANPEARLPAESVADLLEATADAADCDTFGLRLAEARSFASIGPLALLLRHERTLRDALQELTTFRRLLSDVLEVEVQTDDEQTFVQVSVTTEKRSRQAVELTLALTHRTVSGAIWGGWRPIAAWFMHPPPRDDSYHHRAFGCPIRFDAPADGFLCLTASLDRPNAFSDQEFADHARSYLEMLQQNLPTLNLDEQVRSVLRGLIPSGEASLGTVARHLNLHSRVLQRRLSASGGSFQKLLEQTREEMALALLRETKMSVTELSHLLGYRSPTSFTRWFTSRWGKAPSAFRSGDLQQPA